MGIPTCPVCGSDDGFRIATRPGHRSEAVCENGECVFQVAPDLEDLVAAAIATHQRREAARATTRTQDADALIALADKLKARAQADMERVYYSLRLEDDEWHIFRVSFSGRQHVGGRSWPRAEKHLAEAALAEFASKAAEAQGMVA